PMTKALRAASRASGTTRRARASDPTDHHDLRLALSLKRQLAQLGADRVFAGAVAHAAGQQYLPTRCDGLEASGSVDDVTDRREVLDLARADVAHVGGSEVQTNPQLHPWLFSAV